MRAVGLRILVIDEIHHILAGNLTRQKIFLNVIKFLGNELEIPIVVSGHVTRFAQCELTCNCRTASNGPCCRAGKTMTITFGC